MVKKVGKYELHEKIGSGSFGTVYKGREIATHNVVAVKVLPLNQLKAKLMEQFELEVKSMQQLSSPYIVKLLDVMKTARNVYMIMEFCEGGDLEQLLSSTKIPSEATTRRMLRQLLKAILHLNEKRIIHRDLKLANILLTSKDFEHTDIKLADFGFAKILADGLLTRTVLGTPLFMAPEVLRGNEYNYKADIWSLGVITYQLLTGKPAFQVTTMEDLKIAQQDHVRFPADCRISLVAQDAVKLMLKFLPAERPTLEALAEHPFFREKVPEILPQEEKPVDITAAKCPPAEALSTPNSVPESKQVEASPPDVESQPIEVPAFEIIEEVEDEPLKSQYEEIEDEDDEPPLSVKPLEAEISAGFTKELLDLDMELSLCEDYELLAEMYRNQGDYSIAYAVFYEYKELLQALKAFSEDLRRKWREAYPALLNFLSRLDASLQKAETAMQEVKPLVANSYLPVKQSTIYVDSVTLQEDQIVLETEIRRLMSEAEVTTDRMRQSMSIGAALKLAALACRHSQDSVEATNLLAEVKVKHLELLRRCH